MKENAIKKLHGEAFGLFVSSVLKQIATNENKKIFFDHQLPYDNDKFKKFKNVFVDAFAPRGLIEINNPIIFEYKQKVTENYIDKLCVIQSQKTNIEEPKTRITIVIITCSRLKNEPLSKVKEHNMCLPRVNIEFWDARVVERWINEYPIHYANAISFDKNNTIIEPESIDFKESDINKKSEDNIRVLKKDISENENFALVLGAGVSIDLGAKSWDDLLIYFELELLKKGVIKDAKKLNEKVGASSLITAQLCKELYKRDIDFYWAIHNGLYGTFLSKPVYELDEIVNIIKRYNIKRHFRVLTYNFDDYLESFLKKAGVEFNIIYNSSILPNDKLSVYHVHGFMPKVKNKSDIEEKYQKSIYLTEENYNQLYNKPYSWQISSQLSFFMENICLFVGCGLSDPNIRRLLEMTRSTTKKHYAILTKSKMSLEDLKIASNHFSRLGLEIIWVEDFSDIIEVLRKLY